MLLWCRVGAGPNYTIRRDDGQSRVVLEGAFWLLYPKSADNALSSIPDRLIGRQRQAIR